MSKYNIFFIPKYSDRKKISPLRARFCKETHSTQALQYPVHMSLISGGFETKDFSSFEKELKELCKKQKQFLLKSEKKITVLPHRFWSGISIDRTENIKYFQIELQKLRNKYATKKEEHLFHPLHITLTFPAKVESLKVEKNPLAKFIFDEVTIVKKEKSDSKYKIFKRVKLG